MHYNLLFYGQNNCRSLADKNTYFRNIYDHYKPDVITANELVPSARNANSIRDNVLNAGNENAYKRARITNQANSNIINMLYYNSNKVGLAEQVVSNTNLRDINHYKLYHKPDGREPDKDTTFFWVATMHLKAGDGSRNEDRRANMVGPAMGYAQRPDDETAYLISGDMNMDDAQEEAYQILTNPSRNDWEPFHDPLNEGGFWHDSRSYASTHTQSTREGNLCDGGASGGMDDRFDFILISESLENDQAANVSYVNGSYVTAGQEGNRFNGSITDPNNNKVPQDVAISLKNFSDHLPVMLDLSLTTPVADSNTATEPNPDRNSFTAAPNPFHRQLRLSLPGASYRTATLVNATGQLQRSAALSPDQQRLTWQTSTLQPGLYILKLRTTNGDVVSQRLIKR